MKEIPLVGKIGHGLVTIVDDEDYNRFGHLRFSLHPRGYALASGAGTLNKKPLHRLVMGIHSQQIDHINGNKLDNRRMNLREVTDQQNKNNIGLTMMNTSGYRGVCWHKGNKQWQARIRLGNSIQKHLGYFKNIEDAATTYDLAVIEHLDEYAFTNRPREYYSK